MKNSTTPNIKKQKLQVSMIVEYAQLKVGNKLIKATTNKALIPANIFDQRPKDNEQTIAYYNMDIKAWEVQELDKIEGGTLIIGQSTTTINF
jgi:hypothetical protein